MGRARAGYEGRHCEGSCSFQKVPCVSESEARVRLASSLTSRVLVPTFVLQAPPEDAPGDSGQEGRWWEPVLSGRSHSACPPLRRRGVPSWGWGAHVGCRRGDGGWDVAFLAHFGGLSHPAPRPQGKARSRRPGCWALHAGRPVHCQCVVLLWLSAACFLTCQEILQ